MWVYQLVLLFIAVALRLKISKSFLNVPRSRTSNSLLHLSSYNDAFGSEKRLQNQLFFDGLELWREYFNSHYEWKFTKPSSVSIALSSDLETKDTLEFIKELNKDTWKILLYPQLPDLIVKKVQETPLKEEEIIPVVEFFLRKRLYRQLACMIALQVDPPINADHFKAPSLAALISVLEYLFKLKSSKIEEFFSPFAKDKMFLIAPLIACSQSDQNVVETVIECMLEDPNVSRLQLVFQICIGIMITNNIDSQHVYERNEKLLKFVSGLFKSPSDNLKTAIKACHVINLIKLNPLANQSILLAIYMDESPDQISALFTILLKAANTIKSAHYKKLIGSFKI